MPCLRARALSRRASSAAISAASHLVMNGAGLKDVQEILGHKTMSMTMRYSHLSQEHKKKAVNLLNGLTAFGKVSQTATHPP